MGNANGMSGTQTTSTPAGTGLTTFREVRSHTCPRGGFCARPLKWTPKPPDQVFSARNRRNNTQQTVRL